MHVTLRLNMKINEIRGTAEQFAQHQFLAFSYF